jgi:aminopeptidase N
MKSVFNPAIILFVLILSPTGLYAGETVGLKDIVRHDLEVTVSPDEHRYSAKDSITVPDGPRREFHFLLHQGLKPESITPGVIVNRELNIPGNRIFDSFRVILPAGQRTFTLVYEGSIHHPVEVYGNEQARGVSQTPGIISGDGVYLSGNSFWYPVFEDALLSFNLLIELPSGWDAVSQGARKEHMRTREKTFVRWDSPEPQDEIFLIAGRFTEYVRQAGEITAMAFLRTPDEGLARKYLEATAQYIAMYENLIGPYPYRKFALVENFWETGFGMPSFTLLGPTVIRLPFIISSSYPHEILHNWWGNSVFPEYSTGNWAEGLTAYLSDHLIREQQGGGAEYRQTTLQKYADYVMGDRDFPLTQFRSRHSASTEAVGYGKAMMFFHMLRRQLGDNVFIEGLKDFYSQNKFSFASYVDIKKSFEKVSGKNLGPEFDQWVRRKGAPKLKLVSTTMEKGEDGYTLSLLIEQEQSEDPYVLHLPVAVTLESGAKAWQTIAKLDRKKMKLEFQLPSRPVRVDIDPEFDLFRRLDTRETPPAVSQVLGSGKMSIVLPSSADSALLHAYRELAKMLERTGPEEVEIVLDSEIGELPADRSLVILGWESLFFEEIKKGLSSYNTVLTAGGVRIGREELSGIEHSVVLSGRNPWNKDSAMMFIATGLKDALPGLARKLPHYHKYSYLVFEGDEPVNILKGRWPVLDSPMTAFISHIDGKVPKPEMGGLAVQKPLATLPEAAEEK